MAIVGIRDEGEGISAELLPHVFELFTQGERGKDRAQGGLGIGLTMVQKLIKMHGGTVEAHCDGAGKGSEFVVRLPLIATEAEGGLHNEDVPSPASRSLKILTVDDVADSAESLAELLGMFGHQTRVAFSGSAALEVARDWQPEVVLLDIGMPGMDRYETARRLRVEYGRDGMTLIALTGYGQDSDRAGAQEAGFDYLLVKPVDFNALRAALERVPAPPEA